jgi:hypothetical protein
MYLKIYHGRYQILAVANISNDIIIQHIITYKTKKSLFKLDHY